MAASATAKPTVKVFVSYSSKDTVIAEWLRDAISVDGISCYYAPTSNEPLEDWKERIEKEIRDAHVILLLYTDAAGNSDRVYDEIDLARKLNKDVWLLKDDKTTTTDRFRPLKVASRYHAFLFTKGQEADLFDKVLHQLDRRFGRKPASTAGKIDHRENPYPGKPFTAESADLFYGRDDDCDKLLAEIKKCEHRVFFVYGPSGAGKSSLIDAGLRKRVSSERWWLSGPIKPSLEDPNATAVRMWRQAEQSLRPTPDAAARPESEIVDDILNGTKNPDITFYCFWFDQTENLLTLEGDRVSRFFRIADNLLYRSENVRIIITFREEQLARAGILADELFKHAKWRNWLVRRLSKEDAKSSVTLPPERRNSVKIQEKLAQGLVDELAVVDYVLPDGTKVYAINPLGLQIVCRQMWEAGVEGLSDIVEDDVLVAGEGAPDIKTFVGNALTNHLDRAINRIAERLSSKNIEQKKEIIQLGLLKFVTDDRREQLKEEADGNRKRVGRLQDDVIQQLYDEKLLERIEIGLSTRYELVHDSLVKAIDRYRDKLALLQTLNTLESTLRGVRNDNKKLTAIFNRNADLLAELEDARRDETGFFDDEKEFLFRCALGRQRKTAKKKVSLEGWARLVADGCIETFFEVLAEALSSQDDSVRGDAVELLMQKEFRVRLSDEQLDKLTARTKDAALDKNSEVQGAASVAVCQLREPVGAAELFQEVRDGLKDREARRAIGCIRDAIDRREIQDDRACDAFESNWREINFVQGVRILGPLWWRRFKRSFIWMLFVIVLSTVLTALGAAVAFIPMGAIGASLTLANKSAGWAKGPFHGMAGGTFWAIGISSSLMFYWVVLRGGRVSPKMRRWIPAALFAASGGFAAGIALALVIGLVFEVPSLYSAGWLESAVSSRARQRLMEIFLHTYYGWWTPILGAAVAIGVSWGLQNVSGDPRADNFLTEQSGRSNQKGDIFRAVFKIGKFVVKRSWRVALPVAFGGLLVLELLKPGGGVCDSSNTKLNRSLNTSCSKENFLAPLRARVFGIVFIISVGGLFLELGILVGIFIARTGVKVERDEKFLQAWPT